MPHGTQDLSCPTRDQIHAPCSGSMESQPLDHQRNLLKTPKRLWWSRCIYIRERPRHTSNWTLRDVISNRFPVIRSFPSQWFSVRACVCVSWAVFLIKDPETSNIRQTFPGSGGRQSGVVQQERGGSTGRQEPAVGNWSHSSWRPLKMG